MTSRPNTHSMGPLAPDKAAERALRLWSRLPERVTHMRDALVRSLAEDQETLLRRVPEHQRAEARRLIVEQLAAFEPAEITVAAPPSRGT